VSIDPESIWYPWFDIEKLPPGEYEVIATKFVVKERESRYGGQSKRVKTQFYRVRKIVPKTPPRDWDYLASKELEK